MEEFQAILIPFGVYQYGDMLAIRQPWKQVLWSERKFWPWHKVLCLVETIPSP